MGGRNGDYRKFIVGWVENMFGADANMGRKWDWALGLFRLVDGSWSIKCEVADAAQARERAKLGAWRGRVVCLHLPKGDCC